MTRKDMGGNPDLGEEFWRGVRQCIDRIGRIPVGELSPPAKARSPVWLKGLRARKAVRNFLRRWRVRPRLLAIGAVVTALIELTVPIALVPDSAGAVTIGSLSETECLRSSPGHVVIAATWGGVEQDIFRGVLDQFAKQTGIDVTFATKLQPDRELGATLQSLMDKGCAPDVALLTQPGLLQDFAHRNELKPIEDVAGSLVNSNYARTWRTWGSVGGTLYGVWFKANTKSMIWYNPQVLQQAGVQPPTSWKGLEQVAARLRASGVAPFAIAGADGWTLTDWFENVYLSTAGPALYEQLARHQIPWTDPSVTRALDILSEIFGKGSWMAGGTSGALRTSYEQSVADVFGPSPSAAMVYEGDFVENVIPDAAKQTWANGNPPYFDFPTTAGSAPLIVGGDVAVLLTNSEAGKKLIRFLATPQAAKPWAKVGGFLSPNRNLDPQIYPDDATRHLAQQLAQTESIEFDLSDLQPYQFGSSKVQGMWPILQEFLRDPGNVGRTTRELEAQAAAAWAAWLPRKVK